MRTTLTLDDELAAKLRDRVHETGRSFKDVVNEALRRGLEREGAIAGPKPYRVRPASLGGILPGIDLDKALRLADALENEAIAAKLELRK